MTQATLTADIKVQDQGKGSIREHFGNIMELHGTQHGVKDPETGEITMHPVWVAFTTNGVVKQDGEAVMGVGVARLMKERYPFLPSAIGKAIDRNNGGRNRVLRIKAYNLFTFPHQDNWRAAPSLSIIGTSMRTLRQIVDTMPEITARTPVYVERPGYQPDQTKSLAWERVAPVLLAAGADERFVFVAPVAAKGGAEAIEEGGFDLEIE